MADSSDNPESVYIKAMLARTLDNRQLAARLFRKLFSELPVQLAEIETAIFDGQLILAQKEVHKLHGAFGFCGFSALESLAGDLENALLAEDLDKAKTALPPLAQAMNAFFALQESILKKLPSP